MQRTRPLDLCTRIGPVLEQEPDIVVVPLERRLVEGGEASVVLVHRPHPCHVKSIGNHIRITHLARSV